jgi:hypothetical protein
VLQFLVNENRSTSRKITALLLALVLVASTISIVTGGGYNNAYAQNNNNNNGNNNKNNNLGVQLTKPSPDLTAEWWQWSLSFPVDENPILDTTGEQCNKGDISDDIFFLAGSAGGKVERECTISEGQAILIPIVNIINIKTLPEETEKLLLAQAEEILAQQKNLKLIIDGNKVRNLESYKVTNPTFFTVELPENNFFGISAGSYQGVAVGYWVLIEGFSAGEHTLTVDGKEHGQTSLGKIDFRSLATYHLTVE